LWRDPGREEREDYEDHDQHHAYGSKRIMASISYSPTGNALAVCDRDGGHSGLKFRLCKFSNDAALRLGTDYVLIKATARTTRPLRVHAATSTLSPYF
jgi:hypothetical protein